ncbi:alpha-amylase [Salipaludibacillus sp. LMS25]|uniref:alpha-amylase n=1 Tax=Salipaludibacillus sp. LMS25 TaxID=2924031 RepID=UPI0020D1E615|nr:alpha-amylase [Salipaludibacillus sp. LMS25]UTR13210.1 alpha-amylase [Salipaludibacillus sp. LMS25]
MSELTSSERKHFEQIFQFLEEKRLEKTKVDFWIPEIWNEIGYRNAEKKQSGQIKVNPFHYFFELFQYISNGSNNQNDKQTLEYREATIYSSLVRYTAAWDYNRDGHIESGTFLRMVILVPLLKKMGVNILYLLPVNEYSDRYPKGDLGSPYAVKNYFHLDANLHDPLLDDLKGFTIHQEFKALVEACHMQGIKVVQDFIPKTAARNSALIYDHPDWFYWIYKKYESGFQPPKIPGLGVFEECTHDHLERVYTAPETEEHLRKFSFSPDVINPELWDKLKKQSKQTGEDLLELIEKEFEITTAPAHSDWINDEQPVWTDITFLRFYLDEAPEVRPYLHTHQPPYVLFDTIKSNVFPGEMPNHSLWDILEEVITFNLLEYGVDGFRIDIGHALPVSLLQHLFHIVREKKPDAILISEELFNKNHKRTFEYGYTMMLGSGWEMMTRVNKPDLIDYIKELPSLKLPIFACAETADTPRIVSRPGGVKLARAMAVFNHFLPNGVPFITTGQEVNERQPLNCGLSDNTGGESIPRAFFNKMIIDWTNQGAPAMIHLLKRLDTCKKRHRDLLLAENFFVADSPEDLVVYGYENEENVLLLCLNIGAQRTCVTLNQFVSSCFSYDMMIHTEEQVAEQSVNHSELMAINPLQAAIFSGMKNVESV